MAGHVTVPMNLWDSASHMRLQASILSLLKVKVGKVKDSVFFFTYVLDIGGVISKKYIVGCDWDIR